MLENAANPEDLNKKIVRHYLEELWNQRNYAIIDELFSENVTSHLLSAPSHGREEIKENVKKTLIAFPDAHLTVQKLTAENDKVVVTWKLTGKHLGEYRGIPPTGNPVTIEGITAINLEDGQVVEIWPKIENLFSFMQQLGGLPDIEV